MKDYLSIFLVLVIVGIGASYFMFPNEVITVTTTTITIPGDTVTVTVGKEKLDSIKYAYEGVLDSVKKSKTKWLAGTVDTLRDTVYQYYSTLFDLGTAELGVKGKVHFNTEYNAFAFDVDKWRYPEVTKTVVDTVRETKTITIVKEPMFSLSLIHI